jgi:hypothetical protein
MRTFLTAILATALVTTSVSAAQAFQVVSDQSRFIDLVEDKELTRFGIRLTVTPDGSITGKAFGRSVSGNWRWSNGYFCRDLYYGKRDLGPNCQEVRVNGSTVRFTSDRGEGIFADLELQ